MQTSVLRPGASTSVGACSMIFDSFFPFSVFCFWHTREGTAIPSGLSITVCLTFYLSLPMCIFLSLSLLGTWLKVLQCPAVCPSQCVSFFSYFVSLLVCLSFFLLLFICLFLSCSLCFYPGYITEGTAIPICLSLCLSLTLYVCLSFYLSILSLCLTFFPSLCLSLLGMWQKVLQYPTICFFLYVFFSLFSCPSRYLPLTFYRSLPVFLSLRVNLCL